MTLSKTRLALEEEREKYDRKVAQNRTLEVQIEDLRERLERREDALANAQQRCRALESRIGSKSGHTGLPANPEHQQVETKEHSTEDTDDSGSQNQHSAFDMELDFRVDHEVTSTCAASSKAEYDCDEAGSANSSDDDDGKTDSKLVTDNFNEEEASGDAEEMPMLTNQCHENVRDFHTHIQEVEEVINNGTALSVESMPRYYSDNTEMGIIGHHNDFIFAKQRLVQADLTIRDCLQFMRSMSSALERNENELFESKQTCAQQTDDIARMRQALQSSHSRIHFLEGQIEKINQAADAYRDQIGTVLHRERESSSNEFHRLETEIHTLKSRQVKLVMQLGSVEKELEQARMVNKQLSTQVMRKDHMVESYSAALREKRDLLEQLQEEKIDLEMELEDVSRLSNSLDRR